MAHRVLHITTSSSLGGVEGIIARLLNHHGRFEQALIALEGSGALLDLARQANRPAVQIAPRGRFSLLHTPTLRRAMRALRPDIVQSYLPASNLLAVLLSRRCGARAIIAGQHFGPAEFAARPLKAALAIWPLRRADLTVSVSAVARRWLIDAQGVSPERVVVIPNAVDLERFDRLDRATARARLRAAWRVADDAVLFVMLARFQAPKDHACAVQALVRAAHPAVRLAFCGPPQGQDEVHAQAQRHGVGDRVLFPGVIDPAEAYAAADVALLATRSEGLPTALLEGMAMSLPCLASDCGGVGEAVADGETGLLVPVGDPAALAAAIDRLAGDPALRARLGSAGRRRAEDRFALPAMLAAYEALWERALAPR